MDEEGDPELSTRLSWLAQQFGMDNRDLKFSTLLLWFDYLRERATRGRMPSRSWTEDFLPRTIPVIQRWLASDENRGADTRPSQYGTTIINR
jgi:hypothetical protein